MTERYIPGVPCWADAVYADPEAAVEFYSGLFGWHCEDTMPPDHPGHYYQASLDGGLVAAISSFEGDDVPSAWTSYVWVDDADATTATAAQAGGSVLVEPTDIPGSGRFSLIADPQGAVFGTWQADQHRGATKINEHGSVVFNDLYTPDIAAAETFYGQVFGWKASSVADGSMWTMSAYGDHLETLQPGLRAQMAEMGAPGFENVVASVQEAEGAAHWGISFATDDVEATVERATQLGATIVTEPVRSSWVIEAAIEDPQGARFTAVQYDPQNG